MCLSNLNKAIHRGREKLGLRALPAWIPMLFVAACFPTSLQPVPSVQFTPTQEAEFVALVPAKSYNSELNLQYHSDLIEQMENRYLLTFSLANLSKQEVVFPVDFSGKMHVFDMSDREWRPLANNVEYASSDARILAPYGTADPTSDSVWVKTFSLAPDVKSLVTPVSVRVSVVGRNASGALVGAYTDIVLPP